jgi:predicted MPP superfamily phosphohydrolase
MNRAIRIAFFITLVLLVYGGMNLYALGKLGLSLPAAPAVVAAMWLWGLAMVFAPLTIRYLRHLHWHGAETAMSWVAFVWMGALFLFCCLGLAFDLAHVLTDAAGASWPLEPKDELLYTGLPTLGLLCYGFFEANRIKIERLHIKTPKLNAKRITLAQISDMHLGALLGAGFMDRICAKLREINPDVILATGDIVDGKGEDLHALAEHFRVLSPPKGAYAILGNHEYFVGLEDSLRFYRNANFTVLRGERADVGGIAVVGVDDASLGAQARTVDAGLHAELTLAHDHRFIVLLKHQPLVDDAIPFDLQLSGHLHGGQIFPFGLFSRLFYGVRAGLVRLAHGRQLYINRGAGTWGPPIRLFAPPEITLITIESEHGLS